MTAGKPQKTVRLYETEGLMLEFEAEVVSCSGLSGAGAGKYGIVLDRTAFFPGGGGQEYDTGTIGGIPVDNVFMTGETGEICHVAESPIKPGTHVSCVVDAEKRIPRMECHTGEHVFSGVVHRLFGFNNVGFHMGAEYLALDYDGVLDGEMLREAEIEANDAIRRNVPVDVLFPDPEELSRMDYRSKKELSGIVRIVSIEGVDTCACCAPHFPRTGYAGLLTVLSSMPYKGGTRVLLLAGKAAALETLEKLDALKKAAALLSLKPKEVPGGVSNILGQLEDARRSKAALTYELCSELLSRQKNEKRYRLLVYEDVDPRTVIRLADDRAGDALFFIAVTGAPGKKKYIIKSEKADLKAALPFINEILRGRGGGKPGEISGSTELGSYDEIEKAAEEIWKKLS